MFRNQCFCVSNSGFVCFLFLLVFIYTLFPLYRMIKRTCCWRTAIQSEPPNQRCFLMSLTPFFRLPNLLLKSVCSRLRTRSLMSALKCAGNRSYTHMRFASTKCSICNNHNNRNKPSLSGESPAKTELWKVGITLLLQHNYVQCEELCLTALLEIPLPDCLLTYLMTILTYLQLRVQYFDISWLAQNCLNCCNTKLRKTRLLIYTVRITKKIQVSK